VNDSRLKLYRDDQHLAHYDELFKNECTIVVYYSRKKKKRNKKWKNKNTIKLKSKGM
jgi:hypothetical protein